MKRLIFLLLLLNTLIRAQDDIYIGLGPYFQTQPYKDADPVVLASPVIFFDNSLFYIRWTRVGMYFYGHKGDSFSWGASLTAQPQIIGYYETDAFNAIGSRDKTPILEGMEDHESSWEAGLALSASYENYFGEFLLLHDIFNESNALKARIEVGAEYAVGDFLFVPSVLAVYLSQKFTDYYFGIPQEETLPGLRPNAYTADAALNLAAQSYIKYSVSEHWHLLANIRADYLGKSIRNSPLVDDKMMYSGMLSVMYSFNLFGKEKAVLNLPEKK
jgi:outer membrane protein